VGAWIEGPPACSLLPPVELRETTSEEGPVVVRGRFCLTMSGRVCCLVALRFACTGEGEKISREPETVSVVEVKEANAVLRERIHPSRTSHLNPAACGLPASCLPASCLPASCLDRHQRQLQQRKERTSRCKRKPLTPCVSLTHYHQNAQAHVLHATCSPSDGRLSLPVAPVA
jgi:hypothetical protein